MSEKMEKYKLAAEKWLAPARRESLVVGVIFCDLHRFREIAKAKGLHTYQIETQFLKFRSDIVVDLVESKKALAEMRRKVTESEFASMTKFVTTWDDAIEVIAACFQNGNNSWDNDGTDIWVADGTFALNLWRDESHSSIA